MEDSPLKLIAKAKRDYIEGFGSIAQIAERYGLERGTLANRASKEGWKDERDAKLELTPLGNFQAELMRWKLKSTEVLEGFEEKLLEAVKKVKTDDAFQINQLSLAVERFINCTREVGGIPRLAPLKASDKKEKVIAAEIEPVESQVSES